MTPSCKWVIALKYSIMNHIHLLHAAKLRTAPHSSRTEFASDSKFSCFVSRSRESLMLTNVVGHELGFL